MRKNITIITCDLCGAKIDCQVDAPSKFSVLARLHVAGKVIYGTREVDLCPGCLDRAPALGVEVTPHLTRIVGWSDGRRKPAGEDISKWM